jgi:hypothetical protein
VPFLISLPGALAHHVFSRISAALPTSSLVRIVARSETVTIGQLTQLPGGVPK